MQLCYLLVRRRCKMTTTTRTTIATTATQSPTASPIARLSTSHTTHCYISLLWYHHHRHHHHYRQHCAQRNAPVLKLLRGRFWGFSPRRGDTLHRWGWNLTRSLRAKFHPHRRNNTAIGPPKLKFLLRFDQNVEYKRPAGAYPLRDSNKINTVCTPFQDALAVKTSMDLLKELWRYGGFKLTGSGCPKIFSAPSGETVRQTPKVLEV